MDAWAFNNEQQVSDERQDVEKETDWKAREGARKSKVEKDQEVVVSTPNKENIFKWY